jgi:LysM repeat protein
VHIVKKGDSLSTIAKKYSVTVDSIKDANKMKNNNLSIGQSLKILK